MFTPGQLTSAQAARLNRLLKDYESLSRLSVAAPLALSRPAGVPIISFAGTAGGGGNLAVVAGTGSGSYTITASAAWQDSGYEVVVNDDPQLVYATVCLHGRLSGGFAPEYLMARLITAGGSVVIGGATAVCIQALNIDVIESVTIIATTAAVAVGETVKLQVQRTGLLGTWFVSEIPATSTTGATATGVYYAHL